MLKPVQFADWAAPIVPVLKSEKKSVEIFDDSVNQVSRGDSYPLNKTTGRLVYSVGSWDVQEPIESKRHQIAADECPSV